MTLEELRARQRTIAEQLRALNTEIGDGDPTEEQQQRWDELDAEERDIRETRIPAAERRARVEESRARWGSTRFGQTRDPFDILANGGFGASRQQLVDANVRAIEGRLDGEDAQTQRSFERLLRRHAGDTAWALNILARSRPEYESGWAKLMMGRAELLTTEERAALQVGSDTNGGYLVPTHLDPTLILTNDGAGGDIREISRVVTLTVGNEWNGASTAGVDASYDDEMEEVSDDTPTVGQPKIPTHKAQAWVEATIEAFQDINGLESDVRMLFADAKERLQSEKHAVGSGVGEPTGIFTALDANTNVELLTTTAGAIGVVDLDAMYYGLGKKYRRRARWLGNPRYLLGIKALGTAVSASFSGDLRDAPTQSIHGRPVVDSDDAPDTQTTTSRDNLLVFGDFFNYVVVEKPGSMSVEFIPHVMGANRRPVGKRGWYAYWRDGADSVNDQGFRLLQDKTSA